jgi:hypothetical protein
MSQIVQRETNHMPAWLIFAGVAIGVVGAAVKKHAESIGNSS